MRKFPPTMLSNVPTLYQMLLEEPGFREVDFSRLKMAISGAAPAAPELITRLESVIGRGKLCEGWGMTEISGVGTLNPLGRAKIGTVGIPLPGTEAKIVDAETGTRELPDGEPGELRLVEHPLHCAVGRQWCAIHRHGVLRQLRVRVRIVASLHDQQHRLRRRPLEVAQQFRAAARTLLPGLDVAQDHDAAVAHHGERIEEGEDLLGIERGGRPAVEVEVTEGRVEHRVGDHADHVVLEQVFRSDQVIHGPDLALLQLPESLGDRL